MLKRYIFLTFGYLWRSHNIINNNDIYNIWWYISMWWQGWKSIENRKETKYNINIWFTFESETCNLSYYMALGGNGVGV